MTTEIAESTSQETWRNASRGTVAVRKLDQRGDLTKVEIVTGGRTFHITPQERRMNQELAADPSLDVFTTGMLAPVRLLDTSADAAEIAANPNLMSESEMRELVGASTAVFVERLEGIRNPITIQRLLAIALEEDVSVSRMGTIQAQLESANPQLYSEVTTVATGPSTASPERPPSFDVAGRPPRGVSPA